ncbi:MAG: hypothetical protein QOH57_1614 [Mycobacterium sp.]|jgi:hypothetical protein|nr:hypothetical protein [Mycobacterium sp.]
MPTAGDGGDSRVAQSDHISIRRASLAIIAAIWGLLAGAIGVVLGPEVKDRWFSAARSASIERFCLTPLRSSVRDGDDRLWFSSSIKVRIVGYKGRMIGTFVEVEGPDGHAHDAATRGGASDGLDFASPEANDQRVVLYGDVGFRATARRDYQVVAYLADKFGPGDPNLDELKVRVSVNRRAIPRLPRPCSTGSS